MVEQWARDDQNRNCDTYKELGENVGRLQNHQDLR